MKNINNSLYLGLDLSTQSLKATIINQDLSIVYNTAIIFDKDLKTYKTTNGYLTNENNEFYSIIDMFLDALEMIFLKMKEDQIEISKIRAISGCAQQHGSVYYSKELQFNKDFNLNISLKENFNRLKILSTIYCPIWMDSTTNKYVREIEDKFSKSGLFMITGNKAYERFTINQISKIIQEKSEIYLNTHHISLLSSFLTEIFSGKYSGIDLCDGSGMNLLNITTLTWDERIIKFIGNKLEEKIYPPTIPNEKIGTITNYFVEKYGFSKDCSIFNFTGDNICSFIGSGVFDERTIIISLGTSDTIFFIIDKIKIIESQNFIKNFINANLFISPINYKDKLFVMLCTKNGSLVREKFRDELCQASWQKFEEILSNSQPGNEGIFGYFYLFEEILPYINKTNFFKLYDRNKTEIKDFLTCTKKENVIRAIVEGKILSLYSNLKKMGVMNFEKVILTGGGKKLKGIEQIVSDIFNLNVLNPQVDETCAYGGSLKAFFGDFCETKNIDYNSFNYKEFFEQNSLLLNYDITMPKYHENYKNMIDNYSEIEETFLEV